MNRIYQGRVTQIQFLRRESKKDWAEPQHYLTPIWQHHELFQDAVNYYIVALASLGSSPDSKLTKLRGLLVDVWEKFDKKGQCRQGMRESLQRAWQLAEPPTLDVAIWKFREPLVQSGVQDVEMELAGESLAFDLGGEGSIQQGGIEYWPYFCQSGFKRGVTFPREAAQLAKEKAVKQVARLVWHPKATNHVSLINRALRQMHFCNVSGSGSVLATLRAKEVFTDALKALEQEGHVSKEQSANWTAAVEKQTPEVFEYAGGSINKDALKHRFYGFLVFKHLSPDVEGLNVLRSIYDEPEKRKASKKKEPTEKELTEARLIALGEDPIKKVRERARIVFRAFTALPVWKCGEPSAVMHERSAYAHEVEAGESHQVAWKEFDVAAFKEALKVYNQFQQNVEKREDKLNGLAAKLLIMDGERAMDAYADEAGKDLLTRLQKLWTESKGKPKPPTNESGEEQMLSRFVGDARIDRLREIVNDDLAEEYRLTDGRRTAYGLRRRTIKGWGEVKRKWQQLVKKGDSFSEAKRVQLKAALDEMRGGEKREQIGSHRLFEALIADEAAWSIWREPDEKLQELIIQKEWAADPLESFREYCEIREALEEVSARPLNFTPADARFSRRLFSLKEGAGSFGKGKGQYKHDPKSLSVTVPVAVRGPDGRYESQVCSLSYSAPRLLRDQIRAEDGAYAQDWTQPMMRALFGDKEKPSPQSLDEADVQLMPDYESNGDRRILLNFPLSLDDSKIKAKVGKEELWQRQFVTWKNGKQFPYMCWAGDFNGKEPHRWWEKVSNFRVLAADLGTRHAASVALVECGQHGGGTARLIGNAGGQDWFGRYLSGAILKLPGEDAVVLRTESPLDQDGRGKAFREEPYGSRGRPADLAECQETFAMMTALCPAENPAQPDKNWQPYQGLLAGITSDGVLQEEYSFPELNDKLLVAMRRAQNWIATCISWHWKLSQPDNEAQRQSALEQLRDQERVPEWKALVDGTEDNLVKLRDALHIHISTQRQRVQENLLLLTDRIIPLRGRRWEWVQHPEKEDCHLLRQTAPGTDERKTKLRGQRGLSMARIEQLSELRRRWQSLNQSLRRQIGQKPLTASEMRNDPIPDPCPDVLTKLENIREQRVNQTAHLILAQALGLKLREPQMSAKSRQITDTHGEYEKARPPVDMIVLEDLSRYLSDQGRAKSENTRLMKWCHRAIMMKVKMLAEPFGIPVLETPAAYSSRFCSLTGMAGFRAAEVGWDDRHEFRWRVLLSEAAKAKEEGKAPSDNAIHAVALFDELKRISESDHPKRTLLAPQPGGPMFITALEVAHPAPAPNRKQKDKRSVLPMQADLNAAANLAFRAVAHPNAAHIHHRLRTERKKGAKGQEDSFHAREKRRFGAEKAVLMPERAGDFPKEKNTNFFYDEHGVAKFGRARLEAEAAGIFPYASGPGLWRPVNDRLAQWRRCVVINQARVNSWAKPDPDDEIPMT